MSAKKRAVTHDNSIPVENQDTTVVANIAVHDGPNGAEWSKNVMPHRIYSNISLLFGKKTKQTLVILLVININRKI